MEGAQQSALSPEFSDEQLSLMRLLRKLTKKYKLATMLEGAILSLRDTNNPEAPVHAAQSARELMEKFELHMRETSTETLYEQGEENYKDKTDGFGKEWNEAKSKSASYVEGSWVGEIDPPLGSFLGATHAYLEWYENHIIYAKNKERDVVMGLDRMFGSFSQNQQDRIVKEWVNLRQYFIGVAHHRSGDVSLLSVAENLARLVRYMHRRLAPVDAENKAAIKAYIKDWEKRGVTAAAVEGIQALLIGGADSAYFFSHLADPKWLSVLYQGGYFRSPPAPRKKGNTKIHSPWSESQYLMKAAALDPATAAKIVSAMPETENLNVNDNLFRVAAALPAEHVQVVVKRIRKWLATTEVRHHGQAVAKFLLKVIESGGIAMALGMLENLLSFLPPDPKELEAMKRGEMFTLGEPKARLEAHEYGELIKAVVPVAAETHPPATLLTLCRVLDRYARLRRKSSTAPMGYDGSSFWHPSIEDSSQNSIFDELTPLVTAIRDVGNEVTAAGAMDLEALLSITAEFKSDIFRRLEMHWTRSCVEKASLHRLTTMLVNKNRIISGRFDLEYGQLLQVAFLKLKDPQQKKILGWIMEGPELAEGEVDEGWLNRWRMKRLYWIKEQLPPDFKANYDKWTAQFGQPSHPGFHAWSSGVESMGPTSPMGLPDFKALTLHKQIEHVRTWSPTNKHWKAPSREGMANVFKVTVSESLEAYVARADELIGLDPEYISAYFNALWESMKEGPAASLTKVWELARWMLDQPDDETDVEDELTRNTEKRRRWIRARLALGHLIEGFLRKNKHMLPLSERDAVWELLVKLAGDPDPRISDSAEHGDDERVMGPYDHSLNTVRGIAFHAVFRYIWWVRNAVTDAKDWKGLPDESQKLLEEHLKPTVEPTLTIRSVYGSSAARLIYWDAVWFTRNRDLIFPGAAQPKLDAVAWSTFITHTNPDWNVLKLMEPQFRRAISEMSVKAKTKHNNDPRVALGNYLVNLYWWGHLDFTVEGDLLGAFYGKANDDIRAQVMAFVGHSLKQTDKVDPVTAGRIVDFWRWRLSTAQAAKGKGYEDEMGAFVWWFNAEKLDSKWTATQMLEALKLSRRHEGQYLWMPHFANLAETDIDTALQGLELTMEIIRSSQRAYFYQEEEALKILRIALKAQDEIVVERAKVLRDYFSRDGRSQFSDLQ